jgi:hypothetical protein
MQRNRKASQKATRKGRRRSKWLAVRRIITRDIFLENTQLGNSHQGQKPGSVSLVSYYAFNAHAIKLKNGFEPLSKTKKKGDRNLTA